MRLEPLYRVRFTYREGWKVDLEGGWEQHFFIAEGRCEGSIAGRFRGAKRRRACLGAHRPLETPQLVKLMTPAGAP